MKDYESLYNEYLETLHHLYLIPQQEQQELHLAQRAAIADVRMAERCKQEIVERWEMLDRQERELDLNLHRLAVALSVTLTERATPIPIRDSRELQRQLRGLIEEVNVLSKSWRTLSQQEQAHPTRISTPPALPSSVYTEEQQSSIEISGIQENDSSRSLVPFLIGIAVAIAVLIGYYVIF